MITVAIVVCDRDARLPPYCLCDVEEKVHIPHEVIVFDNTEKENIEIASLPLAMTGGVKVLHPTFGEKEYKVNLWQLEVRRQLILAMNGDWIWFVDPDDEVMPIDTEYHDDCGLLNFDCYVNGIQNSKKSRGNTHTDILL